MTDQPSRQHPIRIYLIVWGLLFLVSALSYMTDFIDRGLWRWALILLFMALKAGFIVAVFMHMRWERLALMAVVLAPPVLLLVLVGLMAVESDYTRSVRFEYFVEGERDEALPVSAGNKRN
ncbi:MAG: cytochrome c oxidase subunit IV [Gammaproteobacteria bacterium]|nr:cytochrome C oxidase subunit IV family protein [Pseudomonadales bacterium]GIS70198.1 MAG: cytochrome c oxidase subunit IV [Gammaproteobacteria bacterium]